MKNKQKITFGLCFAVLVLVLFNLPSAIALDKSTKHIGADYLYKAGITGKYQTICVIDDGIDYTHPNLGGCTQAQFLAGNCNKVISGYDFADNDADPMGRTNHGTQVAGIIGSDHDKYKGVAPESKIIAIKVFRDDGQDTNAAIGNAIRQGIRWCADNSTKFNISVISISTGIQNLPQGYSEANCPDSLNLSFEINSAIKKI